MSRRILPAGFIRLFSVLLTAGAVVAAGVITTGCTNPQMSVPPRSALLDVESDSSHLRSGDVVKLTFPGAPNLDTTEQINRKGRLTLPLVGEVIAAGLSPSELEQKLSERYSSELVSSEVFVSVVPTSFPVFVTGAVVRPGKIETDRPLTALEAIMEAGGFEMNKANGQGVVVVRHEEGGVKHYTLNLMSALQGKDTEPFYLKASDIIYVPERFAWF